MIEQIADRAIRAEVATVLRERMPDFGDRSILVVGHAIDHHSRPARSVALVTYLLVIGSIEISGTSLDRPVDIVLGHALRLGFIDGQPQSWI